MTTRIKICGIKQLDEALVAIDAGADALGFVFYPKSVRAVSFQEAAEIIAALPPFVTCVGLLVNPSDEQVASAIAAGVDLVQFHGSESAEFCEQFNVKYVKAIGVDSSTDLNAKLDEYSSASAVLLDVKDESYGGTGRQFDWSLLSAVKEERVIVAGGLTVGNVASLIENWRPYAVDVSSGVERERGIKDASLIKQFCSAVISSNDNK